MKKEMPKHLSYVKAEIHSGIWGIGRVYYIKDRVELKGVTQDVKGLFYEKGFWFEWHIQLNHPNIEHKWELLQEQ